MPNHRAPRRLAEVPWPTAAYFGVLSRKFGVTHFRDVVLIIRTGSENFARIEYRREQLDARNGQALAGRRVFCRLRENLRCVLPVVESANHRRKLRVTAQVLSVEHRIANSYPSPRPRGSLISQQFVPRGRHACSSRARSAELKNASE